jgi:hypothetical protein
LNKRILCYSRYGDPRYITENGGGCYTIEGPSSFCRGAEGMFDFEGGPCLFVGQGLMKPMEGETEMIIETLIPEASDKEGWGKVTVVVI